MSDYKATLNLPATEFPMKASLTEREPARLEQWKKTDLYGRILERRKNAEKFLLPDGPPFANGDIHIGHVVNKTLKDVILRFKSMAGFNTPYVPGFDCHGLPIEHKIQENIGPGWRDVPTLEIRQKCAEYAQSFVEKQSEQFQRVGVMGDWKNPYRTMAKEYEASVLEVFARIVERGLVYQQLKPVNWSIENQTALAEADLERKEVSDLTVFVEFASANPGAFKATFDVRVNAKINFLIWTTTPWTLPANLAIAAGPEVDYALVKFKRNEDWFVNVVAADLVEQVFAKAEGVSDRETLKVVKGSELEGLEYQHPFIDRIGKVVLADYVTTTDGTGLVHTAPGHGDEDYQTGRKYGLEVYCPVLANGKYDATVPDWLQGMIVWKANGLIVEKLKESGHLFAAEKYLHEYPHDARSKKPTIYRATEQWFVSMDKPFDAGDGKSQSIRERGLAAVEEEIEFHPDWGKARLKGMLEGRPDWVLSRQRAWGLPMPIFYNDAGKPLLEPTVIRAVARKYGELGSDAWFNLSPAELLEGVDTPADFPKASLRKGNDTFDVWFESGNSWFAVSMKRPELKFPTDLYLEGSDQHRGWFQLSMLPCIAVTGRPPFKGILTHGFVVKPDGTKVSKSDKEYVTALDEINKHGADVIRLWICSLDYQHDLPMSPKSLTEFADKYRKIRNTLRYLLSNISDFDPAEDRVEPTPASLDGWMRCALDALIKDTTAAYESYQIHRAFRLLHDFCAVQISAVYGNAMKDRLYCDKPNSELRRRAQTTMYECLLALTKLLAPMLVFTADETWEFITKRTEDERDLDSVHLLDLPKTSGENILPETTQCWDKLMELRDDALAQLDKLKKEAGLNKPLDAEIVYLADARTRAQLERFGPDLEDMVGCGSHGFEAGSGEPKVKVIDRRNDYQACARSWKRRPDVGSVDGYPDLSKRDADAVKAARV